MTMNRFLLFLFLPSICFAESVEMQKQYLIYSDKVSQAEVDTAKAYGHSKSPAPLKNTAFLNSHNTNYYILTITTKTQEENDYLIGLMAVNKMILLNERYYFIRPDGRDDIQTNKINDIPADFNRKWSVEVSS